MKKNIIFLSAALSAILFSACERVEDLESPVSGKLEAMSFYASIENDAETKTLIEGNVGDDVRYLKWQPNDTIGIYNNSSRGFQKFVNVNSESSASAVFEGENTKQDVYYAVYPYSESHSFKSEVLTIDLPVVQHYMDNSFGNGDNPMVAHAEPGEELMFQNLCGVLVINLTGDVAVKSIFVNLTDEFGDAAGISGKHTVSMDYVELPTMTSTDEATKVVTLDCGDGVALNASEPTPFHIVLPTGTYGGVNITVLTTDGRIMVKQSKNDLTIKRSRVICAGVLEYGEEVSVDLSERGTSNCYIVSEPGVYSFDATVIGNGEFGLVPDAGFHTDSPNVSPASVELLWEDRPGVVQSVYYQDGRIGFYSSGIEGNALLAAKDASGTIVWSWHIWTIDGLTDHVYVNESGTFTVMDRNLGALSNSRGEGDQWKLSVGTYYQWGRKDPLVESHYSAVNNLVSINDAIAAPSTFFYSGSYWIQEENEVLWSPERKTVYDPCPVGYKIATHDIWTGFSVSGNNDKGLYFIYDGNGQMSWYPSSSWIDTGGRLINHDYESYIWAAEYKENLHFSSNSLDLTSKYQTSNGFNVRCMKDEGYVDVSLPQVQISVFEEITSSSANVVVGIRSEGISEITEKGIIWGTTPDLSDGIRVNAGSGKDNFKVDLTGLEKSSRYYVKPYAINERGESFGLLKSFRTRYTDDIINLSAIETANCYIVQPLPSVRYSFDCTVKGNSLESIGTPASLEVLWEIDGCSSTADSGAIIADVELVNNELAIFELSSEPKEGNALIAAKDETGTIIWSWHIWVTDDPVEQTYSNSKGIYVLLDRNIGATRADRGENEEWLDSRGLVYFWGRKDPFWYGSYMEGDGFLTLEQAVANPTMRHNVHGWTDNLTSWLGNNQHISKLWSSVSKTIYDPCPVGYRVAENDAWAGFTVNGEFSKQVSDFNVRKEFNNGWEFFIDEEKVKTAWYPSNYWMRWYSGYETYNDIGAVWAADYSSGSNKYCLYYAAGEVGPENNQSDGHGLPVRCMKE